MPQKGKKTTTYAMVVFSGRYAGISAGWPELDENQIETGRCESVHFFESIVSNSCYIHYKFYSCKRTLSQHAGNPWPGSESFAQRSVP